MAWGDNDDRLYLRLPKELMRKLKAMAKRARDGKGLTLSELIRDILERYVETETRRR